MRNKLPLQLLCTAGLISCCSCTHPGPVAERPNILILLLDDAGYNDFGFMGSKDLLTPNIDSLSTHGMIFSDAHVSASVSGPSRAGLLTGRYQQRCGYECNLGDTLGLGLEEQTIADIFKANGYGTACIGKWHQGNGPEYHPNRRGFEHFYGFISGHRSYFYNPQKDDVPGAVWNLQENGRQIKFDGYLTDVLTQEACRYIKQQSQKKQPFMLYMAYNAVHAPMHATSEDLKRFEGHPRQKLAAMTWAVDRGIGQIVSTLKQTDEYRNTLIFFLSDNGGAHNNQSCNAPLKGFKGNKFEGGHRVPFFMVFNDRLKGTYGKLTSSLDILSTAAAAAGIDIQNLQHPLDGVNLLKYIDGSEAQPPHEQLFWRKEDMAAMRTADYKYIRVKGVGEVLYDMKDDLSETEDIKEQQPEVLNRMAKEVCLWEKGLVNPILWNEGVWNDVTREIHRDLMNNREVQSFSPDDRKSKDKGK